MRVPGARIVHHHTGDCHRGSVDCRGTVDLYAHGVRCGLHTGGVVRHVEVDRGHLVAAARVAERDRIHPTIRCRRGARQRDDSRGVDDIRREGIGARLAEDGEAGPTERDRATWRRWGGVAQDVRARSKIVDRDALAVEGDSIVGRYRNVWHQYGFDDANRIRRGRDG